MTVVINGTTGYSGPVGVLGDLTTTGNTILGDQSTDTLNVANGNLVLNSSGNLGIGTTSINTRLHVVGLNQTNGTAEFTPNASKGSIASYVHYGTNGDWYIRSASASGNVNIQDTGGNVGIGTSSPAAKLHVAGENAIIDRSGGDPYLAFYTSGSTTNVNIYGGSSTGFRVFTGGSERLRIDSSGNLGLGVTPSAWAWPNGSAGALQLQSGAGLSGYNASTYLSQNWYYNGGEKYVGNGYANRYGMYGGGHAWFNAPNNTSGAGATVSWTQAMTLDASGNLGVGTTSPSSYGKLAVAGNAALNTNGQLKFYNSGNSNWSYIDNPSTDATAFMRFAVGSGEAVRIDSSGNLLVGGTGSASRLHVQGNSAAVALESFRPNDGFARSIEVCYGQSGTYTTLTIEVNLNGPGGYCYELNSGGTSGGFTSTGGGYINGAVNFTHTTHTSGGSGSLTVSCPSGNIVRFVLTGGSGVHPVCTFKITGSLSQNFTSANITVVYS